MKLKSLIIFSVFVVLMSSCGPSRVTVRTRPTAPYVVRPAPPYANAVWIDGEWAWRGGRYEYVHPHYVTPRRGHSWAPGHWNTSRKGDVWVKGRWR